MALPHGGIGGLNIDVVDAQNSGLDLFSRPEIDVSLLQGNDVMVSRKANFKELVYLLAIQTST